MESKNAPPFDPSKKDGVGVVSEEVSAGLGLDLKGDDVEIGADEDNGGRQSKGDDGEVVKSAFPEKTREIPSSGRCRTCRISLNMEEDGRIGMWIDPEGCLGVVVDGTGLCEDCEYKRSIETDPNWGRSRRISSEERSCDKKYTCSSDDEEVSSASPAKKKQ